MDFLKKLGLDPEKMDRDDIDSLIRAADELKLNTLRPDPNQLLTSLRNIGVDIDGIIKKMKGSSEPKHSSRIGRNKKCPCKSGKKYKKCCGVK